MAELTKIAQTTNDLTSAWDERRRCFDALRNLNLDDETRKTKIIKYLAAAADFEKLRQELLKTGGK